MDDQPAQERETPATRTGTGPKRPRHGAGTLTEADVADLLSIVNEARMTGPLAAAALVGFYDEIGDVRLAYQTKRIREPTAVLERLDAAITTIIADLPGLRDMIRRASRSTTGWRIHQRANEAQAAIADVHAFVLDWLRDPPDLDGNESQLTKVVFEIGIRWEEWTGRPPGVSRLRGSSARGGRFVRFVQRFLQAVEPEGAWGTIGASVESILKKLRKAGTLARLAR